MNRNVVGIEQLSEFLERIDVRSPAEYAEDHLPSAKNYPVLNDAERAEVGTIYQQDSPFAARKIGAVLASRNIAHWLETVFVDRPPEWRPLIYCWRGGKRSAIMTHLLNEVGWRAVQLQGGYKAYRRYVVDQLNCIPAQFRYRVICGLTGSGKSRLLRALHDAGAQVLDLEQLARHRGSLLGDFPGEPQPSQKRFESLVWEKLTSFHREQAVFVESESKKIGQLQVPDCLLNAMWASECIWLDVPFAERLRIIKEEYQTILSDTTTLLDRLIHLQPLYGRETIEHWRRASQAGNLDELVSDLLKRHYDPIYLRSMRKNYAQLDSALNVQPNANLPRELLA